jgi:hypothetical protein
MEKFLGGRFWSYLPGKQITAEWWLYGGVLSGVICLESR